MNDNKSLGITRYHDYTLGKNEALELESGEKLYGINIRYEYYGKLNSDKSNAILVVHALTGNHHAAGRHNLDDKKPGWWDKMIGINKALDTSKYFVLCINNLGGCSGTTGPNSINPHTDKPYAMTFPIITIADMVKTQIIILDHLEIPTLYAVVGGSMGAMMGMYFSVYYPKRVKNTIIIASTAYQNAQSIAFSEVARQAIMGDPEWHQGNYAALGLPGPKLGLGIARMLAHITYLSDSSMRKKFGRRLHDKEKFSFTFDTEFEVESYLKYQGGQFTDRFDANSYLYITKALNYFNLSHNFSSLKEAFLQAKSNYLVICFSTDWIYPPYMSEDLVKAMIQAKRPASYSIIDTQAGHDAFLLEWEKSTQIISAFFKGH